MTRKRRELLSSFPNDLGGRLVIAHRDEAGMPQMTGIGPFNKCHPANQVRCDPTTLFHLFRG
jgi:hypothetical protein